MTEHVVTSFGEHATLHRAGNGNILCPICGFEYRDSAGWEGANFLGGLDNCPCCHTQMGNEDIDEVPPVQENPIHQRWDRLRRKWLDKVGWAEWAVRQASDRLGDDVRR
jgi:hypothetical protein